MAERTSPPFRADHVGSLLRPRVLLQAREDHAAGRIGDNDLRVLEDEAIREVVALQREVGLRSATDGEFRRASMEWDDARSGGFEPLRFVPKDKVVVLGLVTTKRPELEGKELLKRRIDEASRYVDVHQLCLSPQCGFSSTQEGNELTRDDQIAKLRLVVETAEEVWG